MTHFSATCARRYGWLLLLAALLLPALRAAQAQPTTPAPGWGGAAVGSLTQPYGTSTTRGVATDAAGNMYVTGSFTGQVAFGSTLLVSAGNQDLFVAKYVPATGTWAWAQRGGGTSGDEGFGIAVSGTSVYVTGSLYNARNNALAVSFGGTSPATSPAVQLGATTSGSTDMVLAKYTDNGTSVTFGWSQVGGGIDYDYGASVAVSGSSVYVAGSITNTTTNGYDVVFGGAGATAGTTPQAGTSPSISIDIVLAKYIDNGPSATLGWTQVGGGLNYDTGGGVAVSGSSVYLTGSITNTTTNAYAVVFGGSGTTAGTTTQPGTAPGISVDLVLAKYTDNGATASLNWLQVAGGTQADYGYAVAVSGASVYVAGIISNNLADLRKVVFGGGGTVAGTVPQAGASAITSEDLVLAKYTDNGATATFGWSQVGGGTGYDRGVSVAVRGPSVYVAGWATNTASNANAVTFGGSGTTAGTVAQPGLGATTSEDLVLAKYTDNGATGTFGWSQVGGGTGADYGTGVAVSGTSVYAAGFLSLSPIITFGTATGLSVPGTFGSRSVLAQATDAGASGSWAAVAPATNGGQCWVTSTATGAAGSVYVAGYFTGQVAFGATLLSSAGSNDFFVAKYVPATGTWAWAQRGGGIDIDIASGVAVSGTSVYVTGYVYNNASNTQLVTLGGAGAPPGTLALAGASSTVGADLFIAKYTDQGATATASWAQTGGGTSGDYGTSVAVRGTSVYVAGGIVNNSSNANAVVFGSGGTAAQFGASPTASTDQVLVKYTDNGPSATFNWSQVSGGTGNDQGTGVAVSGTSVYVVGTIVNSTSDVSAVVFGGSGSVTGTTTQLGAAPNASNDLVLAKYTDNGATGTFGWSQVAGGTNNDYGSGVAVRGTSVYVAGTLTNTTANANAVVLGGSGTVAGTTTQLGAAPNASNDLVLAKYTDNGATGTFGWSQVGGGTGTDQGSGVAVSGSNVYLTGFLTNTTANASAVVFGGGGPVAGTVPQAGASPTTSTDLVLAKYLDNGPTATFGWSQVGGGAGNDQGAGVAVSGQQVYVAGYATRVASFGPTVLNSSVAAVAAVLPYTTDATLTPLPTRAASAASAPLVLYPNPSAGRATLGGAAPGAAVQVLDALGRVVATATANAAGTAALVLPAGLPGGVYVVRTGTQAVRLAVE